MGAGYHGGFGNTAGENKHKKAIGNRNPIHKRLIDENLIKVDANGNFLADVFEFEGDTITDCIEAFENAPIWAGKTFYDAESEMTWIDWQRTQFVI